MLAHQIVREQLAGRGKRAGAALRLMRVEGCFYRDGAVFKNGDGAGPIGVICGFEGQGVWAFGDAQRCRCGAYEFAVEKDFCAVGVGGDFGDAKEFQAGRWR